MVNDGSCRLYNGYLMETWWRLDGWWMDVTSCGSWMVDGWGMVGGIANHQLKFCSHTSSSCDTNWAPCCRECWNRKSEIAITYGGWKKYEEIHRNLAPLMVETLSTMGCIQLVQEKSSIRAMASTATRASHRTSTRETEGSKGWREPTSQLSIKQTAHINHPL